MTADREALVAEVARVLAKHEFMPCSEHTPTVNAWWAQCEGCDWKEPRRSHRHAHENDHRTHLADALADLLDAREQQARAEELREAAEDMPFGYTHAAHLLRDRAARIEADA